MSHRAKVPPDLPLRAGSAPIRRSQRIDHFPFVDEPEDMLYTKPSKGLAENDDLVFHAIEMNDEEEQEDALDRTLCILDMIYDPSFKLNHQEMDQCFLPQ